MNQQMCFPFLEGTPRQIFEYLCKLDHKWPSNKIFIEKEQKKSDLHTLELPLWSFVFVCVLKLIWHIRVHCLAPVDWRKKKCISFSEVTVYIQFSFPLARDWSGYFPRIGRGVWGKCWSRHGPGGGFCIEVRKENARKQPKNKLLVLIMFECE